MLLLVEVPDALFGCIFQLPFGHDCGLPACCSHFGATEGVFANRCRVVALAEFQMQKGVVVYSHFRLWVIASSPFVGGISVS